MNYWTTQALANDYHAGDQDQADLITAENNIAAPITCTHCDSPAHYKHTIGTHKCINCGRISVELVEDSDGDLVHRFA